MTFCKVLASAKRGEHEFRAYECIEKFSAVSRYEIVESIDGMAINVIPTARTTWKKKFKQLTNNT